MGRVICGEGLHGTLQHLAIQLKTLYAVKSWHKEVSLNAVRTKQIAWSLLHDLSCSCNGDFPYVPDEQNYWPSQ